MEEKINKAEILKNLMIAIDQQLVEIQKLRFNLFENRELSAAREVNCLLDNLTRINTDILNCLT